MTEPEPPITTIEPANYEVLRLCPIAGGETILRMDVQDGQMVAHYAPTGLGAAAQILVDELVASLPFAPGRYPAGRRRPGDRRRRARPVAGRDRGPSGGRGDAGRAP